MNHATKSLPAESDNSSTPGKKKGRSSATFQIVAIVAGISVFSFVIYKAGYKTILESLGKVGWGFLFVVALNGAKHLLRAFCVFLAVPNRERSFKYRHALEARLGGEAAGVISFTGGMVSEATKAGLLKQRLNLSRSITALIVDNLIYIVSIGCLIFSGSVVLLVSFNGINSGFRVFLSFLIFLMIAGLSGIILTVTYQVTPVSFLLKRLDARKILPGFLSSRRENVYLVEKSVTDFYKVRRATFLAMLSVNFAVHLISVFEIMYLLGLFGVQSGAKTAFVIESLTKVINFSFGFIPGNLGVYEGGASVIFLILGMPVATGVALALVRRGAILTWTASGIVILILRTLNGRRDGNDRIAADGV